MTQTIYPAGVAPGAARRPADVLMNFIVSLLAPMFLFASDGDVAFARLAAIETVNAYRARNQADLVAIAQIIGFGLAALGSLSLSMADDISLAMTLRLRGNANALHRSAEQNRRALQDPAGDDPMPDYVEAAPDPETAALIAEATAQSEDELLMSVAAARLLATKAEARLRDAHGPTAGRPAAPPAPTATQLVAPAVALAATKTPAPVVAPVVAPDVAPDVAPVVALAAALTPAVAPAAVMIQPATMPSESSEAQYQQMWAIAMVEEAEEMTAGLPNLPAAERATAMSRIAALTKVASELLSGDHLPPPS